MAETRQQLDEEMLGETVAAGFSGPAERGRKRAFTSSDEGGDDAAIGGQTVEEPGALDKGKKRARSDSSPVDFIDAPIDFDTTKLAHGRKKSVSQTSPVRKKVRKSVSSLSGIPLPPPATALAPASTSSTINAEIMDLAEPEEPKLLPNTGLLAQKSLPELDPPPLIRPFSVHPLTGLEGSPQAQMALPSENALASSSLILPLAPPKAKRKSRSKAALGLESKDGVLSGTDAMILEAAGQPLSRGGSPAVSITAPPKPKRKYAKKPGEPGPGKNWRKGLKDVDRIPGSGRSSAASSVEPSAIGYTPSALARATPHDPMSLLARSTPITSHGQLLPFDHTHSIPAPGTGGLFSAGSLVRPKSQIVDDDIVELLDIPDQRAIAKRSPDVEGIVASEESDNEMENWPATKISLVTDPYSAEPGPNSVPPPQMRGPTAEELKAPADREKLGYPVYSMQIPGKAIPVYRIPSPVRVKEKEVAVPSLVKDNVGARPRTWLVGTRIILGVGGSHLKLKSWMSTSISPFAVQKQAEAEQRARVAYEQQVFAQSQTQPGFQPVGHWASSLSHQTFGQGTPGAMGLESGVSQASGSLFSQTPQVLLGNGSPGDIYAGQSIPAGVLGYGAQVLLHQPPPIPGMQKKKRGKAKKEDFDGEKMVKKRGAGGGPKKQKYDAVMDFARAAGSVADMAPPASSPTHVQGGSNSGPIAMSSPAAEQLGTSGPPEGAEWTSVHPSSVPGSMIVDLKAGTVVPAEQLSHGDWEGVTEAAIVPPALEASMEVDREMEELL